MTLPKNPTGRQPGVRVHHPDIPPIYNAYIYTSKCICIQNIGIWIYWMLFIYMYIQSHICVLVWVHVEHVFTEDDVLSGSYVYVHRLRVSSRVHMGGKGSVRNICVSVYITYFINIYILYIQEVYI
jgi:hypothetical protein